MAERQTHSAHFELVAFSSTDPANPRNWSPNTKRLNVLMVSILTFVSIIGSSLYAPSESQIRQKYGVGADVATLGLSLYVLGFSFGPFLWGPLGEICGRKRSYLIGWTLFLFALAPSAWINDLVVIFFFRFLAGAAGSVSFNNGSAVNADLYSEVDGPEQAVAANYYSLSAFAAPVVGPVIGFFISSQFPDALWTLRVQLFLAFFVCPIVILLPETHGPTILAVRAERMRQAGHPRAWAHRELQHESTAQLMRTSFKRPLTMLVGEPIVMGAAVWTSLTYGILYFFFEAYPVVFIQQNGIPVQLAGLSFIPIAIGMAIAAVLYVPVAKFFQSINLPRWLEEVNDPKSPESRMKLAAVVCFCLPISSFWLAWSSSGTHWIVPALSGIFFGFADVGISFIFIAYLSDVYTLYTASAVAATQLSQSVIGAILPIVAHSLLDRLGTQWGISLFGFISLALFPVPLLFLRYGKRLRASSHYSQEAFAMLQMMQPDWEGSGPGKDGASLARDEIPNAQMGSIGANSAGTVLRIGDDSSAETLQVQLSTSEAGGASRPTIQPLEIEVVVSR